jgi:DNA-binding transcriptional LysR family regulator
LSPDGEAWRQTRKAVLRDPAIAIYDGEMSIDPKSLELFLRVVDLGTIAAAAQREHIAAAAVSKRISDLERDLGAALIVRSNKGITPTAAGRALIGLSQRVLSDLNSIRAQMRDHAKGIQGQVRVYANISAITQFMPAELQAFLAENPHVRVHLEERVSTVIAQAVAENVADIGILILGPPVDGLEFYPYREDDLVLVAPKGHPLARRRSITFQESLDFDFVGLHAQSQLNLQLIRAATDLGRAWQARVHVTSYDALCHMVQAGMGIGVLPWRIAQSYAKALGIRLVKLQEPWAHRTLAVCVRSYEALAPAPRLLVDRLLRSVSAGERLPMPIKARASRPSTQSNGA